jgi:hypothetical protein
LATEVNDYRYALTWPPMTISTYTMFMISCQLCMTESQTLTIVLTREVTIRADSEPFERNRERKEREKKRERERDVMR